MEKETVINRFKEFDTFLENIDQKIEIKCGLKYIEFTNNKISNFEMEYFDDFAKTKDLHLFLGTSQLHHLTSKNPFMIIGTFHPKIDKQTSFF